jgi:hypothetical protein
MRLTEILKPENIIVPMQAKSHRRIGRIAGKKR